MSRRFFLGVDLTDDMRHGIAAHLEPYRSELPGIVSPPDNWHLTLRFVGPLTPEAIDRLLFGLSGADWPDPFRIRFGPLEAFPNHRRATVLWMSLSQGEQEMRTLANVVERTVRRAGIVAEERPFVPHLTLSRVRPPADVRALIEAVPPFEGKMDVARVDLFESVPDPRRYPVIDGVSMVGSEQTFD